MYLKNCVIFVLSNTIVGMETDIDLPQTVVLEEVMEQTYNSVRTFPTLRCLVNQIIDLSWDPLTADSKYSTLSCRLKIHWAGLKWVVWVMYLLCEVEGIVDGIRTTT